MSLLTAYLSRPATQRVLNKKPGQEGFTLIELVVVIAILAVLIVVALPNFQGVTDDAAAAAGKKYLVDAFTECEVARTRGVAKTITAPTINRGVFTTTTAITCPTTSASAPTQTFTPGLATIPIFTINLWSGEKTCVVASRGTGYGCNSTTSTW